jgi:hypothetical protein
MIAKKTPKKTPKTTAETAAKTNTGTNAERISKTRFFSFPTPHMYGA